MWRQPLRSWTLTPELKGEPQVKPRLARLGVLLAPIMALAAGLAPPADAVAIGGGVLIGTATVANGLAYPCFAGKGGPFGTPPTVNPAKCPVLNTKPDVAFTFVGTMVGALAKANKPKCGGPTANACVEAGVFNVTATGVLDNGPLGLTTSPKCGLSSGSGAGNIAPGVPVVDTKPGTANAFTFSFEGIGGLLVIQGTFRTDGVLAGVVVALPDALVGRGCLNKAAKDFIVVGPVVVFEPNL